jgi:hypothetical protein
MVMRNRIDGDDAPRWWDDLPPKIRERVAKPVTPSGRTASPGYDEPETLSRRALVRDLSRLAAMLALVTVGIMFYLLLVVMFVTG